MTAKCRRCNCVLCTTEYALARHIEDHDNDKPIKLARIHEDIGWGCYRPEHHYYNQHHEKVQAGGGARYCKFLLPNRYFKPGCVSCWVCPVCNKWEINIAGITDRCKVMRFNMLRDHERKCILKGEKKLL